MVPPRMCRAIPDCRYLPNRSLHHGSDARTSSPRVVPHRISLASSRLTMAGSEGFQFRQFYVRHDRCAMKVGTDGVLLGAWAPVDLPFDHLPCTILDIGTGSGLVALMMAQRVPSTRLAQSPITNHKSQIRPGRLQPSLFSEQPEESGCRTATGAAHR